MFQTEDLIMMDFFISLNANLHCLSFFLHLHYTTGPTILMVGPYSNRLIYRLGCRKMKNKEF